MVLFATKIIIKYKREQGTREEKENRGKTSNIKEQQQKQARSWLQSKEQNGE